MWHIALHLSALPRQRIELLFDEKFYIEASFECRFDHIEVRDGPFSFSPLINRFCGASSPGLVLSSGRFMWIRFFSDDELEGIGFRVQYSFTAGEQKTWCSHNTLIQSLCCQSKNCTPTDEASDHVICHYLPPKDPEFHLHVGGLLNPIPGSATTLLRPIKFLYLCSDACGASSLRHHFHCPFIAQFPCLLLLCYTCVAVCGSDCQFELSGADGLIRSSQVEEEYKVKPDQAVDCIWTIRAPTNNRVCFFVFLMCSLFACYLMHNG